MKRILLVAAAIFATTAFPAFAGPDYVARIPLSGGFSVFEFYMDKSRLPECEGAGSHPGAVIANIETPSGTRPYGTGCWIARIDGNIWIAVKSFDDGVVRETLLHNSQLKAPGSDKPSPIAAPRMAAPTATKKTYRIDMADTDVTLEDEPCKTGGKKASFTHKLYDIGGFGCWVDGGQKILVHWTQKKTLSGNIEPFDLHSKIDRPADMPFAAVKSASDRPTGKAKELIARVDQLNDRCRGGSGDDPNTMKACEQREAAMAQVRKAGWCWGPEDAPGYEQRWIRCR